MYFFYLFFLFFIFFFLFIILLFPVPYTYREIVPGLGSVNYGVNSVGSGGASIETAQFTSLVITDGENGSPGAGTDSTIDFGGSGVSTTTVGFIPQYLDSKRPLKGYFKLFINYNSTDKVKLLFRVVDTKSSSYTGPDKDKLSNYNIGWTPLTINNTSDSEDQLYQVNVPFDTSSITTASEIHKLEVQVSYLSGPPIPQSQTLQLYSASVYYY